MEKAERTLATFWAAAVPDPSSSSPHDSSSTSRLPDPTRKTILKLENHAEAAEVECSEYRARRWWSHHLNPPSSLPHSHSFAPPTGASHPVHALSTGCKPRAVTAMTMLKQMLFRCVSFPNSFSGGSHILDSDAKDTSARLWYVDVTGPQLITIHPHGSADKVPYVTMVSGSLAAMAVFEAK